MLQSAYFRSVLTEREGWKELGAGETLSLATHAEVRRGQVALTSSLSRGSCKRKTSINQLTFFLNRLWESVSVYMYVFNWWFLYHKYTSVYLKKEMRFELFELFVTMEDYCNLLLFELNHERYNSRNWDNYKLSNSLFL